MANSSGQCPDGDICPEMIHGNCYYLSILQVKGEHL